MTRHAAVLTAVLGLLAGCGSREPADPAVATAGDIEVTLSEFHAAYNRITPNYRPDISSLEAKRNFANDLVNREILLAESARMGGITDPKIVDAIASQREQAMLAVLYRNEVEDKVEVLGRDVADLWERRKFNIKMSHILLETVDEAAALRARIVGGEISFEDAAKKYSMDLRSRRQGGSLGEIVWSRTLPTFQRLAFDMEPGKISEPVETEFGVHLIRVDERVPQELGTLEEMRPILRSDARRQMEAERMREFVGTLEEQAGLAFNDEGLRTLQGLIREFTKVDMDTVPVDRKYLPQPTDEQRQIPLASFHGRDWTIGDWVDYLAEQPPANRIQNVVPVAGLREVVRGILIQPELLRAEAEARGYGDLPEVQDQVDRTKERIEIELVHARFIQAADVPEEDVKALYDSTYAADPEALRLPEQVDMLIMVHTDSARVAEGLREIRAGQPEAEVIARVSMDGRTRNRGGRTGLIARGSYAPQIEDAAFSRKPGSGWSDPIVTESGTGAIKVLERQDSRLATFDDVKDVLTSKMAQARGEAAFEEWLNEQRERRGVEIHDDVLEKIGQPVS